MHVDTLALLVAGQQRVQIAGAGFQAVHRHHHVAGGEPGLHGGALLVGHLQASALGVRGEARAQMHRRPAFAGLAAVVAVAVRRAPVHRDAAFGEQRLQRQVLGAVERLVEEVAEVAAGDLLGQGLHALLRHADAGLPVALPQQAHQVVQAARVVGPFTQGQIQRQRHQGTLGVVADDGVGGVFILLIEARPGVEAGLGDGLLEAPPAPVDPGQGLAEQFQIALRRNQPGARQGQIVVVAGDALEGPQQFGVHFPAQVEGRERLRLDALHVPGVEILVAAQPEVAAVAVAHLIGAVGEQRQVGARAHQAGGIAVLQPAVAVGDQGHEQITVHRRRLAEQLDMVLADRLQVAAQPRHVGPVAAAEHHVVGHAAGFEAGMVEMAHLHRMIDQGVVIVGAETAETQLRAADPVEPGGQFPGGVGGAVRGFDVHLAGLVLEPHGGEKQAASVEIAVGGVQVGAAHRQVPGVHLIAHRDRPAGRRQLPGLLVQLGHVHGSAGRRRFQRHDMAGEVTDHVAAGDPGGQGQPLPFRRRPVDGESDLEQMRLRAQRTDLIMNHTLSCGPEYAANDDTRPS